MPDQGGIDPVKAYEAQTGRIMQLGMFLSRFAPGPGDTRETIGHQAVDDDTPGPIVRARDAAVTAAFEAIRAIARNS